MVIVVRDGYMTIEATYIMLMTFSVILFLFYAGIYQYDRCVIKQDAYRSAMKGSSICKNHVESAGVLAEKTFAEYAEHRYIGMAPTFQAESFGILRKGIRFRVYGELELPVKDFSGFFSIHGWNMEETGESLCRDPVFLLRMFRQVLAKKK